MRVIICGSRTWVNQRIIKDTIYELHQQYRDELIIIHGDHWEGADRICSNYCSLICVNTFSFPADWHRYGKSAGSRRNQLMIDIGMPYKAIAFDLGTAGTADMIRRCIKANIPVEVIKP